MVIFTAKQTALSKNINISLIDYNTALLTVCKMAIYLPFYRKKHLYNQEEYYFHAMI